MPDLNKVVLSIAAAIPRDAMMSLWTCLKRAKRVGQASTDEMFSVRDAVTLEMLTPTNPCL